MLIGEEWDETTPFFCQDDLIPVVDEYVYLGVLFNRKWDLDAAAEARAAATRKAMLANLHVISSWGIPASVRVMLVKALVLPVARWGGELIGMEKRRAARINIALQDALRRALGAGRGGGTPNALLWKEAQSSYLHSILSSARARAWKKWATAKTVIAELIRNPMKCKKGTWVSNTQKWLKTYPRGIAEDLHILSPEVSPSE